MDNQRAKKLLEDRRTELEDVIRVANEQASLDESQAGGSNELSTVDQHPADLATDTVERGVNLSVRETAEAGLRDVERALQRVRDGNYGVCPACKEPIPDERLEARPEAEFCVEHQPANVA